MEVSPPLLEKKNNWLIFDEQNVGSRCNLSCHSRVTLGEKVVSVKATPGHTKILQTLKLNENTLLCDSPGVVFPRLEVPREAQIVGALESK